MTDQAPPPTPEPIDYSTQEKRGLFSAPPPYDGPEPDKDAKTMAMLSHLLAVLTGIIGPLLIWLLKKDQHPFIDDQGKQALNFQLTLLIAYVIAMLTWCLIIGMVLALVILVAHLVFTIIAAIKANQGIAYRYPFAAQFIK